MTRQPVSRGTAASMLPSPTAGWLLVSKVQHTKNFLIRTSQLDGREIEVREDREDRELLAETGGAPGGGKRVRPSDETSGYGSAYSGAGGTQARCAPPSDWAVNRDLVRPSPRVLIGVQDLNEVSSCEQRRAEAASQAVVVPKVHAAPPWLASWVALRLSVAPAQIVVHGLPYTATWQDLKDLTRTITAAAGREITQVINTASTAGRTCLKAAILRLCC